MRSTSTQRVGSAYLGNKQTSAVVVAEKEESRVRPVDAGVVLALHLVDGVVPVLKLSPLHTPQVYVRDIDARIVEVGRAEHLRALSRIVEFSIYDRRASHRPTMYFRDSPIFEPQSLALEPCD